MKQTLHVLEIMPRTRFSQKCIQTLVPELVGSPVLGKVFCVAIKKHVQT